MTSYLLNHLITELFHGRLTFLLLSLCVCVCPCLCFRHEGEMYRALLSDYEVRQQALMQENVELKKLLQHIKKDMVSILSPKTHCSRTEDSLEQVQTRRI